MSLIASAFLAVSCVFALLLPWVGVLAYYLFSVMQMQYLWPMEFGQGRVQIFITLATIIGLAIATALQQVNWKRLLTPFSLLIATLVIIVNLSNHYSAFELYVDPIRDRSILGFVLTQEQVTDIFNKTLFFFYISVLLIDTRIKLMCTIYMFAGILVYYALWANKVYFTYEFWRFGDNGRLGGPLDSVYKDENYLAMLYVMATPVLYYLGVGCRQWVYRYAIWFFIPLTWHALFLTSSRGGALSLAVVCIYIFFRSFNKWASIFLVAGLTLAIVFQSGQLLTRVDKTVDTEALETMPEQKLDPRIISWTVATEIVRDYPLLGVGVGNFYHAFSDYRDTKAYVVHNTFLQFSANCGIISGLIYLWFFIRRFPTIKRSADVNGTRDFARGFNRDYLDDLLNSLMLAFFMVAIFLDLMVYEIFWFIILMTFSKYMLDRTPGPRKRSLIDSIYTFRRKRAKIEELAKSQ